ncbi:MAG: ArsR family transcriptional regulator [Candidatus Odinarchaeota archaeon]|nr:ArsR family transcriptional regulator [Candidatus Odinarchaeota archaeon]
MSEKFDFSFRVLSAISGPLRVEILKLLSRRKFLSFTEMMYELGMTPKTDAGKFAYHLNQLREANLVLSDEKTGKYFLSPLGERVVDFLWLLEDFGRREFGEIFVRTSKLKIERFDRSKIAEALKREAEVPQDLAEEIAREAEERLFKLKVKYLTAPLIREFVNAILLEKGFEEYRHSLTRLGLPVYDVSQLIKTAGEKTLFPNPELARGLAGDSVFEQYLLLKVLPRKIADAHLSGKIHIPRANYWILKPYGIQHNLAFLLNEKLSLNDAGSIFNPLIPPENVNDVPLYLYNLLTLFDTHFSSAQSIDFFNIFLAPFFKSINHEKIKNILKKIIELLNMVERKTTITFNLEFSIPKFLESEPAIGFKGKEDGTYGEYENESRSILRALIEIFKEKSSNNLPYIQPQLIFKIREVDKYMEEIDKILELSLETGQPLFANLTLDWQLPNTNYSATIHRLGTSFRGDWKTDTIGTGYMDWIAINMVRIAITAKGDDNRFFEKLEDAINCAVQAFLIKREEIRKRVSLNRLLPLLNLKIDGSPYFMEETASYSICYTGLPEAIQIHTSSHLSEEDAIDFLTKVLKNSYELVKKIAEEKNLRLNVMETPSIGPSFRFLKLDSSIFRDYKYIIPPLYSTGIIPIKSDLSVSEKAKLVGKVNVYLKGGQILNIDLDEELKNPSLSEIRKLTGTILASNVGLFAYTRSLTYCLNCKNLFKGILNICPVCNQDTEKIAYNTRLTGTYMFIHARKVEQDILDFLTRSKLMKWS